MSVIMMLRVKADPERLETWASSNAETINAIADASRAAGAVHHMFAAGEGEVFVIDEWPDPESFQTFFNGRPDIADVMKAAGTQGQPEITFLRKMNMPDEF